MLTLPITPVSKYFCLASAKWARASLLHTHLQDAVVLADGAHQGRPLLGQRGHGLFHVNVLAGLAGVDGDLGVHVVEGRHDDAVDVLAIEQLMVIGILIDAGLRHLLGLIAPGVIDVGNRHPFDVAGFVGPGHQVLPALARADDAEPNAVIRPPNTQGRSRGGRADHKSPSRNVVCQFDTPPCADIRALCCYRGGTMRESLHTTNLELCERGVEVKTRAVRNSSGSTGSLHFYRVSMRSGRARSGR